MDITNPFGNCFHLSLDHFYLAEPIRILVDKWYIRPRKDGAGNEWVMEVTWLTPEIPQTAATKFNGEMRLKRYIGLQAGQRSGEALGHLSVHGSPMGFCSSSEVCWTGIKTYALL
jgi:hypothetical protein